MTAYIVLFRGINVGGSKVVKMEALRDMLRDGGFVDAQTYVQSGNVVLTSSQTARQLTSWISEQFPKVFGFESRVVIRSRDEWNSMIAKNPYPQADDDPKSLHAVILDDDPTDTALSKLEPLVSDSESFTIRNRVLYLHTPDGFGKSKLAAALDRTLKVPLTARNWRTVRKLQEMAKDL